MIKQLMNEEKEKVNIVYTSCFYATYILGDPGADSGGEGKSKQAEKYGTKEK